MRTRRFYMVFGAAVGFVLLVCLIFSDAAVVPTGAWGLDFGEQGEPPRAPTGQTTLAKYDAAYLGDTRENVLYLTFDAGYENGFMPQILDVLKKHEVPAAFFLVGDYFEMAPDLVRRMVQEGHTVGNHTNSHPDMSKIAEKEAFARELSGVENLYRNITGQEMEKFYRPPQGVYSEENLRMAQELGYKTVFWSLAYADWDNNAQPTAEKALSKLLPRTHPGAVVLLHATSKTNAAILDELLTKWKDMGYTFAPVSELFS